MSRGAEVNTNSVQDKLAGMFMCKRIIEDLGAIEASRSKTREGRYVLTYLFFVCFVGTEFLRMDIPPRRGIRKRGSTI